MNNTGMTMVKCMVLVVIVVCLGLLMHRVLHASPIRCDHGLLTTSSGDMPSVANIETYVINLDRRDDRMAVTIPKLKAFGFGHVRRFSAVDARTFSRVEVERLVKPDALAPIWNNQRRAHHELTIGAVGCVLSHVRLWEMLACSSHASHMLVFEDDTNPSMTADEVDAAMRSLPADWDMLFLGIVQGEHNQTKVKRIVKVPHPFYGMHAYLITKKCVPYLLANALPMSMQLDSWLSSVVMNGHIKAFTIENSGWTQNSDVNSTDIQTPIVQ